MSTAAPHSKRLIDRVIIPAAQALGLVGGLVIILPVETIRLFDAANSEPGTISWLFQWNIDTTPWVFVLAVLPFAWRRRPAGKSDTSSIWWSWLSSTPAKGDSASRRSLFILALIVGGLSFQVHRSIGRTNVSGDRRSIVRFMDLPPAYHDEYSYLFQARTFRQGHLSTPSPDFMPQMFDQIHVLNEGRMASRYFPGVGAWMAPFDAIGNVIVGHWFAGALAAVFVFLAGREIGGTATGLLAGILFALAPGIGLFGNLLLAHHPTLFALCLFLFAYLRFCRDQSRWWAMLAGAALVFAMLCRPMTAAGFGFPFGVHLFSSSIGRSYHKQSSKPLSGIAWMGLPIACGFAFLLFYNHSITGDAFRTPYQVYTDIYTPRHVYGFNNVVRGEQYIGPRTIENYDSWAENLDWPLAMSNVFNRIVASFQWTLGLVPVSMALAATLVLFAFLRNGFRLVVLAFVSLHLAHIPYWFDGIMHWHYVFETAPLLCLICAVVLVQFSCWWIAERRTRMVGWGLLVLATAFAPAYAHVDSLWPISRISAGVSEVAFARKRYAAFHVQIDEMVAHGPADQKYLVLIIPNEHDRHIDFVFNNPGINDRVIYARTDANLLKSMASDDDNSPASIIEHYNDRDCVLFSAVNNRMIPIR